LEFDVRGVNVTGSGVDATMNMERLGKIDDRHRA
jgi:hypothetical protein